jgi:hypothetical protein
VLAATLGIFFWPKNVNFSNVAHTQPLKNLLQILDNLCQPLFDIPAIATARPQLLYLPPPIGVELDGIVVGPFLQDRIALLVVVYHGPKIVCNVSRPMTQQSAARRMDSHFAHRAFPGSFDFFEFENLDI